MWKISKKELIGKQFGEWTVLAFNGCDGKNTTYLCRCSCGTERHLRKNVLIHGLSKSCGCKRGEHISVATKGKPKAYAVERDTYGEGKTRLHIIWDGMKKRCNCLTDKHYKWYGARGIKVCEEWSNSFQAFKSWALNYGYMDDLSIDRIDNDGNYEPSKCRWVTHQQQMCNTRRNRMITYNGETKCVSEWGKVLGMSPDTIYERLKHGWSIEKTLTTPVKKSCRKVKKSQNESD